MTAPETPRQFLQSLDFYELMDALRQSRDTSFDSGTVDPEDFGAFVQYQVEELSSSYRGLGKFVTDKLYDIEDDGTNREFVHGFILGALGIARAITIVAENREIPEL